jgi:transketolase
MNYQEIIKKTSLNDDRIIVMTAENRAVLRELPNLLGNRFIDTGITEQTMIGSAAGLALRGRIPICHALATFLTLRAFEFIRTDVGIANLPVKLSGFIPGFLSDGNGPTHQSLEDISIMRGIPNMEVYAPADNNDMVEMLPQIWSSNKPSYLRLMHIESTFKHSKFILGKAEIIEIGNDINILVYGFMFKYALETTNELKKLGYSVGLVNMRSLKPIDEECIINLSQNGSTLVTIEDHFKTGGLYTILAETLLKNNMTVKVIPIAMEEKWFKPGRIDEVLENEGFSTKKITERILNKIR